MHILYIVIAFVAAYIIGSFPTAYLVGRYGKGIDIREVGSHNLGAMNVFYKIGFVEGMIVLLADIGKGALGVAVAAWLGTDLWVQMVAGALVVIGHGFPIFLNFRGGKGGAACIGILMYFMPWGVPIYLGVFLILLALTRAPTISYSLAFFSFPLIGWLINHDVALVIYSLGLVVLPLVKYLPRIFEMRKSGGSWKHVVFRKSLKDRL